MPNGQKATAFVVMNLATQAIIQGADGNPMVLSSPASANMIVSNLTRDTGQKHQIRPYEPPSKDKEQEDREWQAREQERVDNGEYQGTDAIKVHLANSLMLSELIQTQEQFGQQKETLRCTYPHASKKQRGKIAYTPNREYGIADRQKVATVENYIKDVLVSELAEYLLKQENTIQHITNILRDIGTPMVLRTFTNSSDIVDIYTDGPEFDSCMRHPADHFQSYPHHPCEVYGAPGNVYLAVLVPKEYETSDLSDLLGDGIIKARCIVHNKVRGRIFSDSHSDEMASVLKQEGYSMNDREFVGAKLNKIVTDGQIVCPYLDVVQAVRIEPDWLIIDYHGENATGVDGVLDEGTECYHCGDRHEEDEMISTDNGHVCSHCRDHNDYYFCHGYDEWYRPANMEMAVMANSYDTYSEAYLEETGRGFYSDHSCEWFFKTPSHNLVEIITPTGKETWSTSEMDDGVWCDELSGLYYSDAVGAITVYDEQGEAYLTIKDDTDYRNHPEYRLSPDDWNQEELTLEAAE